MVSSSAESRVRVRISTVSGGVSVIAEPRADVVVDRRGSVETGADGTVEVRPRRRSDSLEVRCPEGADVIVGTRSGGVELNGRLGAVGVTSQSGSIRAGVVAEADLRTVSGSVQLEACDGHCRASTTSGRITVGTTGDAEIATVSGVVGVDKVAGTVRVKSVSGKVSLGSSARGPVQVSTVSGSITIRLPPGVRPEVRTKGFGKVKSRFEPGADVLVDIAQMSGTVRLVSA